MNDLQLINSKLDKIIDIQSDIKRVLAIHDLKHDQKDKKLIELEETASQYKADKYKVLGASGVLAGIISYLFKH